MLRLSPDARTAGAAVDRGRDRDNGRDRRGNQGNHRGQLPRYPEKDVSHHQREQMVHESRPRTAKPPPVAVAMPGAWAESPDPRARAAQETTTRPRQPPSAAVSSRDQQRFSIFDRVQEEFEKALDRIDPMALINEVDPEPVAGSSASVEPSAARRNDVKHSVNRPRPPNRPEPHSNTNETPVRSTRYANSATGSSSEMGKRLANLVAKAEDLKSRYASPVRGASTPQNSHSTQIEDRGDYYTPRKVPPGSFPYDEGEGPATDPRRPRSDERSRAQTERSPPYYTPAPDRHAEREVAEFHSQPARRQPRVSDESEPSRASRSHSSRSDSEGRLPASSNPNSRQDRPRERIPGGFPDSPYNPTPRKPGPAPVSGARPPSGPRMPGAFPDSPYQNQPAPSSARREQQPRYQQQQQQPPLMPSTAAKTPSRLRNQVFFSPTGSSPGSFQSPGSVDEDGRKVRFKSTVSERTISYASPASSARSPYREPTGSLFDEGSSESVFRDDDFPSLDPFAADERIGGLAGSASGSNSQQHRSPPQYRSSPNRDREYREHEPERYREPEAERYRQPVPDRQQDHEYYRDAQRDRYREQERYREPEQYREGGERYRDQEHRREDPYRSREAREERRYPEDDFEDPEEDEFWSTPRRSEARDRDHHPSQHSPSRSRSLSPTRSPPPDFEEEDINFGELYARAVGGNDDSGQDKDDIWGKGFLDFNENSVELPANLMDDADGYDRERDSALSRSASMSVLSEIHSDRSLLGDVRYPEEPRPRVGLPPLARGPRPQPPKSPSRQRQPAPATQTTPTLAAPATNPAVLPSPGTFFASKSGPIGALEETGITPSQRPQFYTPQTAAARADDGTPTNTVLQGQGSAEEEAGKADAQAFFAAPEQQRQQQRQQPPVPVISIKATPSAFVLSPPPPVPDGPVEIRRRAAGWTTTPARERQPEQSTPAAPSPAPVQRHVASVQTGLDSSASSSRAPAPSSTSLPKPISSPRPAAAPAMVERGTSPPPFEPAPTKTLSSPKPTATVRTPVPTQIPAPFSAAPRTETSRTLASEQPESSLFDDIHVSVKGRNSLPKDATKEQIERWLGVGDEDGKGPSRETPKPPTQPAPTVGASTWTAARAGRNVISPEPVVGATPKSPDMSAASAQPLIVLPSTAFTTTTTSEGRSVSSSSATVSIKVPPTSPGMTSRIRCVLQNPGVTNATWMIVKVGPAKAQIPDLPADQATILVEDEVFRWSEEKGVVPKVGWGNEVSLRLAFLPTFIGRYQQTFHVRCRGRIIVLEVVGVAVTKSGIGLDAAKMFDLPSTIAQHAATTKAPEAAPPERSSRIASASSTTGPIHVAKTPDTPLQNQSRIRDILRQRAMEETPARVAAPLDRAKVAPTTTPSADANAPKLFSLEVLRRPQEADPPSWLPRPSEEGEVIQVFDLGIVSVGESSKMTMRACNYNRTSVLIKATIQGRDAKSFVLPFRSLLVPRESFVPFPIVFQPDKAGNFEQEVVLSATGGGGTASRMSLLLRGTATAAALATGVFGK